MREIIANSISQCLLAWLKRTGITYKGQIKVKGEA